MSRSADSQPTRRLVEQRIRNRVIEYLELAASFEEQLAYERSVQIAFVPHEVIDQWGDWVPADPREHAQADVYTDDEVHALRAFHTVWERVAANTPNPLPPLSATQALPEWDELRQAALAALRVFQRNGLMPEEHEI